MRLVEDFTPLAVGESDWRAFDYTKDLDGEVPSNPRCVCTWSGGPGAGDPSPQTLVGAFQLQTTVVELVGPLNTQLTRTGRFLAVYVGPPPIGAAGGFYLLQGLVDTPTRHNLSLSARLPCSAT